MKLLEHFLSSKYYVPVFLLVICLTTSVIVFRKKQRFAILKWFPFYMLISAIQMIISFICAIYLTPRAFVINNYSIFLFVIIELYIFYNLTLQLLNNEIFKRSMRIIQYLFLFFTVYSWTQIDFSESISRSFYIIDSVCMIIACLFYFFEIFTLAPSTKLSNQPSFWVMIGFSFLSICTLPFYTLENFLFENLPDVYNKVCTLSYVFYSLLFILIAKAFLCQPIAK